MRFFLAVSWSILKARLSLSAVSSSIELLAVLTSTPSFLRRSITSALVAPRSRASWKTRTLCIMLVPLGGGRLCGGRLGRSVPFAGRGLALGLRLGRGARRREPRRLLGVTLVPHRLRSQRRLAQLLGGLRADALDALKVLDAHLQEVLQPLYAQVDQLLGDLVLYAVLLQAAQLL